VDSAASVESSDIENLRCGLRLSDAGRIQCDGNIEASTRRVANEAFRLCISLQSRDAFPQLAHCAP
jgi:hypothetical protein